MAQRQIPSRGRELMSCVIFISNYNKEGFLMNLSDLRQQPHLSASSIGDYLDCGMLYKFGRVDRLPREYVADALEFGSVITRFISI
jgi:hypothetical protein